MELFYPTARKPFLITQKYEQNANSYYKEAGMVGHGALDVYCEYNETIYCAVAGEVFAVRNKDNPDLMRYRAVYTLIEAQGRYYEVSYGHANLIFVKEGDIVEVGTPLMTGGNTGNVSTGGRKITKEDKLAGSKAGTHLHFQVREVIPTDTRNRNKQYLENSKGVYKRNGQYFEILDYNNGYLGCIDPMPFFNESYANDVQKPKVEHSVKHRWSVNLQYGQYHEDIKQAQRAFMVLGLMDPVPEHELGWFGKKTEQAMFKYQASRAIVPAAPKYLGPKTRASLNIEFSV